jgi:hypothetical protein
MHAAASKGMNVGKLLASWRRKVSLAVHVAHADNILRGSSSAADCVEATTSSAGVPSPRKAFFTRAMQWAASVSVPPRVAREAQLVTSTFCVFSVAWEFIVFSSCVLILCFLWWVCVHFRTSLCRALDCVTHLSLLPAWFFPLFPCPRASSAYCTRKIFLNNIMGLREQDFV